MSAKKLVVSTYLRYVFIALGAPVFFVFVRQLGSVPLTFLAAVLAHAPNSVVRALEGNVPVWRTTGGSALYGVVGVIFAFAIGAATPRYPCETLLLERWRGYLFAPAHDEALPGARSLIAREG